MNEKEINMNIREVEVPAIEVKNVVKIAAKIKNKCPFCL